MKKSFVYAAIVLLGAISAVSCDSGMIWDVGGIVYGVRVSDAEGNDLLDPSYEKAIDYTVIEATFRGETYKITTEPQTRAYKPTFRGLELVQYTGRDFYQLSFGELEGTDSYVNEELVINWPDGTQDVVSFDRDFKWALDGSPKVKQKWYLNGVKQENALIEIIK